MGGLMLAPVSFLPLPTSLAKLRAGEAEGIY